MIRQGFLLLFFLTVIFQESGYATRIPLASFEDNETNETIEKSIIQSILRLSIQDEEKHSDNPKESICADPLFKIALSKGSKMLHSDGFLYERSSKESKKKDFENTEDDPFFDDEDGDGDDSVKTIPKKKGDCKKKKHLSYPPIRQDLEKNNIVIVSMPSKLSPKDLKFSFFPNNPKPRLILHAFNMTYSDIMNVLEDSHFRAMGFTDIQISPSQQSMQETIYDPGQSEGEKWYLRYLPKGYRIKNCYGSKKKLKELIVRASKQKIGIIADVVFNHVAGYYGMENHDWAMVSGSPIAYRAFLWETLSPIRGLSVHNTLKREGPSTKYKFIYGDERVYEACMEDFYDWKSKRWFMGAIPTLKPSQNVLNVHLQYLGKLLKLGVSGFRFDAADHLSEQARSSYIQYLDKHPKKPWYYLEMADGSSYAEGCLASKAPITHYPAFHALARIFSYHGDLRHMRNIGYDLRQHVVFGETHDTAANRKDPSKGINAYIPDQTDTHLAIAAMTARHSGNPLILIDNAKNDCVAKAILFRHLLNAYETNFESPTNPQFYESIYSYETEDDPHNFIVMVRSGQGMAVFNKRNKSYIMPLSRLPLDKDLFRQEFLC
ncbi:MAG: alpha-amylase family glycosyl hydrolase, partial [Candidatus Nucleicultricaceae bacterium]